VNSPLVVPPSGERLIFGEGTLEEVWVGSGILDRLPGLDLAGCDRAVVLAPHPDDETLGVGGMIATLLERGSSVVVVFASDGEASHAHSTVVTPDELRARRTGEAGDALAALSDGLSGRLCAVRLQVPDGRLAENEDHVAGRVGDLLQPGDWCVATWDRDGHPDHEAVGRAGAVAAHSAGARLLTYPVWTWHWAEPDRPELPWSTARRLPLSLGARSRKSGAVSCYRSQTEPLGPAAGDAAIVPPSDLAHFERPFEVVFT
jgi:LmbE family N-acetylglucosaminyl deacetylase